MQALGTRLDTRSIQDTKTHEDKRDRNGTTNAKQAKQITIENQRAT